MKAGSSVRARAIQRERERETSLRARGVIYDGTRVF